VPNQVAQLQGMKGLNPRLAAEQGGAIVAAVARGLAVPDSDLPRFPRSPRWEKDPQLDQRVSQLKSVRDSAAQRLDLDPGVLCARDRLEAVARRHPSSLNDFAEIVEMRRWQVEVLGEDFVKAMRKGNGARAEAPAPAPAAPKSRPKNDSPYSDG
jgi:ribonuclease D